ncbi:hypothetical protein EX30DRAFT_262660 [Ascodesmis nigricans]|uniref:Uncharacterized protein n=1 Tax=Ascodesmis nigricans TaxID=341454 RepID=A0A4S2MXW1_9PEZI|nr:hypothetical protein EX30DRAFT_262660 [Ascodesmis nigricans]
MPLRRVGAVCSLPSLRRIALGAVLLFDHYSQTSFTTGPEYSFERYRACLGGQSPRSERGISNVSVCMPHKPVDLVPLLHDLPTVAPVPRSVFASSIRKLFPEWLILGFDNILP